MIGETISHYKIIEKLGEGGMGIVYLAEDLDLKRTVAIKTLYSKVVGAGEEKERFIHEARAAASLNHPNICTIHEIGEEDGRPYIVMEHIAGINLRTKLDRGPVQLDEAVEITMQTSAGLQEAHEKGIIHRDIKPANLMFNRNGDIKIMDFGLARTAGMKGFTQEGSTLGTVAYMSPEQSGGDHVDNRTDIWSLGVILYEMLTGKRPFTGDYDQAVIYSIMNSEIDPPTALRTGVPIELESVVLRCLARDPGERYQTLADLSADLRRVRRSMKERRAKKSEKKKKGRIWFGLAAALIVMSFAVKVLVPIISPPSDDIQVEDATRAQTRIVVLPFENLSHPEDDYFAAGLTEEITSRLASIQGLGVISRKSALYYKNLDRTIEQIGKELHVDFVLEGTVRWQKEANVSSVRVTSQLIRVSDDSHIWAETFDENFERIFDVQARIAGKVAEQLDLTLSTDEQESIESRLTDNVIAYQLYLKGAELIVFGHQPEESYRTAQMYFEQAVDIDPEFAMAWAKLCHAHRGMYFFGYDRTPERLEMAKSAIDRALEIDPDLPEVHRELGFYYYHGLLDYDKALEEFERVARGLPNDATSLYDIGLIWRRRGEVEAALGNFLGAFSLNPKDPGLCIEIANTFGAMRQFEEGVVYADSAISMSPYNHWGYFLKALLLLGARGDVEGAKNVMRMCPVQDSGVMIWGWYYLEKLDRNYDAALDHLNRLADDVIRMQSGFIPVIQLKGNLYYLMGKSRLAAEAYGESLVILEEAIRENPEDPRVLCSLGFSYAGLERKKEAVEAGRKAVEIYPVSKDALLGPDRLKDLAQIYTRVGDYAAAVKIIRDLQYISSYHTVRLFDIDPSFDPLKNEPGYQELVREFIKP
ncbi:MAG: protein kinase [Candidatus Krumholzibacteriota bacterium]|nr:protein kinase [Candidatus Krumholzibacteriota bacterium]